MSIFDQFSKVTKDFGNKAQEMTKDIKGKLEEQQAISRLNAQINEAKNQMKNTYLSLIHILMENPDILLLDEPLSGLDNDGVQEMWKLFLKQKEDGKLIVLASHSKEDIGTLCDEIFRFDKGKMVGHEIKRE